MSKIIAHLLVGIVIAVIIKAACTLLLPASLNESEAFDFFISLCYVACVVIPCIIYFIKMPPGKDNRG